MSDRGARNVSPAAGYLKLWARDSELEELDVLIWTSKLRL